SRYRTLSDIFGFAVNVLIGIGWALVFIFLALGFIKYITSRGETKSTDQARQWLTYAALGGVGLFFLTAIRFIITNLLGSSSNLGPSEITNFLGS
ncbi:MAG TPA: hypothetical protein VJG85_00575, partial [Patescibacteria group bacterium]|nr:hypothetical protein [Patescibacteria group bacterium]